MLLVNVPIGLDRRRCSRRGSSTSRASRRRGTLRRRRRRHGDRRRVAARLRAGRRRTTGLGLAATIGLIAARHAAAGRVRRDRARARSAARAVRHLPPAHADRRLRRRGLLVGIAVLDVLLHLALHAAGARLSAIKAGLSYLPLAMMIIISAGVASQVVDRIGFKPVLATGLGLISVAMVWWAQIASTARSFRRARAVAARGDRPRPVVRERDGRRDVRRQRRMRRASRAD